MLGPLAKTKRLNVPDIKETFVQSLADQYANQAETLVSIRHSILNN